MKRVNLFLLFTAIFLLIFFPFRIIQIISIFLVLLFLFSYLYSKIVQLFISIEPERPIYYCKHNEDEYYSFKITNSSIIPFFNVFIRVYGNGCIEQQDCKYLINIPIKKYELLRSKISTNIRGSYLITLITISYTDPFNFFPWSKNVIVNSPIIIYPNYHDIRLLLVNGEKEGHKIVKNFIYEDLSRMKSIRDFIPGDSLQKVNWKVTAKVGTLQTMEFSNTLKAPLFIIMDLNPNNFPIKHRYIYLERVLELVASLIISFSERGESCGLISNHSDSVEFIPQHVGYEHSVYMLNFLASINFDSQNSTNIFDYIINQKIVLNEGSHLYFLLPKLDDQMEKYLRELNKRKNSIKLVNTCGLSFDKTIRGCEILSLSSYGEDFFE